ncbi:hypothetical protein [Alteromonas macleodii]|uniref:Uncharacterized protein n=1 Tax=Alteromonas macleodii TaxID=28108 RepID=A0AB36FKU0_ALTMA|nr:hypothetical protein [Alteromonas macleodii]OES24146.1 hypothetical protein BFV93_4746 [Alteromonas macleodii]OES24780.1 hypothetical protein BFV95_4539 [Alteromonas macleodii]OES25058.1 hypothetical protein BFV94_4529 [Alteromonas macleodii]
MSGAAWFWLNNTNNSSSTSTCDVSDKVDFGQAMLYCTVDNLGAAYLWFIMLFMAAFYVFFILKSKSRLGKTVLSVLLVVQVSLFGVLHVEYMAVKSQIENPSSI